VILGYPVASLENVRKWSSSAPSMIELIDEKMPPCFIFGNRTDETVPVESTLKIASALERYGVGFELHVYSWGPHGFSTGDSSVVQVESNNNPRSARWVAEAIEWLKVEIFDFAEPIVFQR
jgi:acetyl esterase/lipase